MTSNLIKEFQLTIDRAHTSAIVSASGFGPSVAVEKAMASDLEIWNISTKSITKKKNYMCLQPIQKSVSLIQKFIFVPF